MDQTLIILSTSIVTLTNIQLIYSSVSFVAATIVLWSLLTRDINKKIEKKANTEHVEQMFKEVDQKIQAKAELVRIKFQEVDKDIVDIKQTSISLKQDIMTELQYIRNRVDTMADSQNDHIKKEH